MDINIGDKIKYSFPDSTEVSNNFVTGIIESVYESHIVMKTEENVKIKINFKNLEYIEIIKRAEKLPEAL